MDDRSSENLEENERQNGRDGERENSDHEMIEGERINALPRG